jgi:hypothetical protein
VHLAGGEYDRRVLKKADDAVVAEPAPKGKGKKRDVECYNCHKRGRIKAECWAREAAKKAKDLEGATARQPEEARAQAQPKRLTSKHGR